MLNYLIFGLFVIIVLSLKFLSQDWNWKQWDIVGSMNLRTVDITNDSSMSWISDQVSNTPSWSWWNIFWMIWNIFIRHECCRIISITLHTFIVNSHEMIFDLNLVKVRIPNEFRDFWLGSMDLVQINSSAGWQMWN